MARRSLRHLRNSIEGCVSTLSLESPLLDLTQESGQVWIGTVRPLAMRYGVFDNRRVVMVAALPVLLPKSEPQD